MKNVYLFIINKKYTQMAKVSISSFLKTNPKNPIIVYTEETLNIEGLKEYKIEKINKYADFNDFCNFVSYRLELLDELKNEYDNICILDVDTLFLRNMDEIFSYPGIAGVNQWFTHKQYLDRNKIPYLVKDKYINIGSCKLDCNLLRQYNLVEEFEKELKIRANAYTCPEQDLINYLFYDKIVCIPNEFNNMLEPDCTEIPRMIHYVGKQGKPWNVTPFFLMTGVYPYYEVYYKFIKSIGMSFCLKTLRKVGEKNERY